MPVMLKMLPPLLLLAAATNASAATYDICAEAGSVTHKIAQARDDGILMSKFLIDAAGDQVPDAELERYFLRVAQIYIYQPQSADELRDAAVEACNGWY